MPIVEIKTYRVRCDYFDNSKERKYVCPSYEDVVATRPPNGVVGWYKSVIHNDYGGGYSQYFCPECYKKIRIVYGSDFSATLLTKENEN